jgi:Ni,Fe-hydrogenase maturation factor
LPEVRTRIVHQLTPELAEELSTVSRAVFVDASTERTADGVTVKSLKPGGAIGMSHVFDPQALLCLAQTLFGHAPRAWLVQVAGDDFGAGEGLSEPSRRRSERAVQIARGLLRASGKNESGDLERAGKRTTETRRHGEGRKKNEFWNRRMSNSPDASSAHFSVPPCLRGFFLKFILPAQRYGLDQRQRSSFFPFILNLASLSVFYVFCAFLRLSCVRLLS